MVRFIRKYGFIQAVVICSLTSCSSVLVGEITLKLGEPSYYGFAATPYHHGRNWCYGHYNCPNIGLFTW